MFNMLVGLGFFLVVGVWFSKLLFYMILSDISLYYILGFFVLGFVWLLVVLLLSNMYFNKLLGVGLMIIYLSFFVCSVSFVMGDGSFYGSSLV